MRRFIVVTAAVTAVAGLLTGSAPAKPPADGTNVSTIGYYVTWTKGQPPKVTEFRGSAPDTTIGPGPGGSGCVVDMATPQKENSTTVDSTATATCTSDVDYIAGTDTLYRGIHKGPYVIGAHYENYDRDYGAWLVEGTCASSTWAYYAEFPAFEMCSTENGCAYYGPLKTDYHYWSC